MVNVIFELSDPMPIADVAELSKSAVFNAPFDAYIDQAYIVCTEGLTDSEKAEVNMWRTSRLLPMDFWDTLSKPAHNAIHGLISYGLGQ